MPGLHALSLMPEDSRVYAPSSHQATYRATTIRRSRYNENLTGAHVAGRLRVPR
jgi:hypothetical protein